MTRSRLPSLAPVLLLLDAALEPRFEADATIDAVMNSSTLAFDAARRLAGTKPPTAREGGALALQPPASIRSLERVLVVDDDPSAREALVEVLRHVGFLADAAADGKRALELAAIHDYAVIVLDWLMPVVDGLALVEPLRARQKGAAFLLITGVPDFHLPAQPSSFHFDGIIRKPWTRQEVTSMLDRVLALRRERQKRLPPAPPASVLLIEDELADARLVTEALSSVAPGRYRIDRAVRLSEGLDLLSRQPYEAVVVDLTLPDARGLDGVAQIRSATPGTPVIVLTGRADAALALHAAQAGAQDFLVKGQVDGSAIHRSLTYALERKRAEKRMTYLAHHDALTRLPNRRLFQERLAAALARARRHDRSVAVLFIDVDGLKGVNDLLGHDAGDRLLVETARRIQRALREYETAARLGGDEFAVIVEDVEPGAAVAVAKRLLQAVAGPFAFNHRDVNATASIGVALFPEHGDGEELLQSADEAMYQAKRRGGNDYQVFNAA
jgi:diguanylate cyclase (GGDEF)-like protein